MTIKCVIVDDEPLALEGIKEYIDQIPYLHCIGTFNSALDLLEQLDQLQPQLLFLDIQMPYLSGIDFIKSLQEPPKVIFTTAYNQYALQGFELDVVDYLMKPVSFERFLKASEKAKRLFKEPESDWFFVKTDKRTERINYEEILWIESLQNYAIIHLANQKHIVHFTLKSLLSKLPEHQFIQTHKSYIVNLMKIDALEGNQLIVGPQKIPISRKNREMILEKIVNSKLLKR